MWEKLLELGFHNQENKVLMLTSTGEVQLVSFTQELIF